MSRTADYRPWIGKYPHLMEEIEGVGEGAGISSEEALLMQCRGEFLFFGLPECTGFAASGEFTKDGAPIAGQNFDLEPVDDFVVLLKIRPDKGPSMLILTVAGGIGYGGLNSDGLAVDLNLVSCAGWRGRYARVPRYPAGPGAAYRTKGGGSRQGDANGPPPATTCSRTSPGTSSTWRRPSTKRPS